MSSATPKGSDSTVWTRRGEDSPGSWRPEREPAPAFRGVTRGRGRGGGAVRGRQGGGRGAGNRSVSARGALDISKSTPPPLPQPVEKAGTGGPSAVKISAIPPPKAQEFPKMPSRPNLTVDAQAAQSSVSTLPLSPSKPTRRRRNTHKRSASAAIPKPIPTSLTDALPTSPSAPLIPSSKEVPPPNVEKTTNPNAHVHDLRKEITNLVQHVRNMAMDANRPNSPTTHIDWAGEDDDSLPDLDDWGISSKLVSDVSESAAIVSSKSEPIAQRLPDTSNTSIPEKAELKDNGSVAQIVTIDGAQSSAESPTESSMSMTLSVPPPVKRARERRRGGRRDREKRASLASQAQVNGSSDKQVPLISTITTPKKSLLERISSPVRTEPPPPPQKPEQVVVPPVSDQAETSSKSEPNVPHRGSLPSKPLGLPKKPPPSAKTTSPWRTGKVERPAPLKGAPPPAQSTESVVNTNGGQKPLEPRVPEVAVYANVATKVEPPREKEVKSELPNDLEATYKAIPALQPKETTPAAVKTSSFDWSEEPASFDTSNPAEADDGWPSVEVEVEPATPSKEVITTPEVPLVPPATTTTSPIPVPETTETKSKASASPRFRSQRPLSGDSTPRPRRERSPYKTHNPRNHSMPHAGSGSRNGSQPGSRNSPSPSPFGRPHRPQHASRPIIRVDALAMITRSLRESTPPRKESPPVTKVDEP